MIKFKNGILVECDIPFVIDLIPKENKTSRPQRKLTATSITVHNPGNKGTAKQQSDYIDEAYDRYASWHFTIGSDKVYQELPINEVSWHAGDGSKGKGNNTSISIEVEETPEAEELAAEFIRQLRECLGIYNVYPHKHWTGKNCPRMILPHWDQFIRKVKGTEMTKREIQAALKQLGYYKGAIDGSIGYNSRKAVKAFQKDHGLAVDGSPGQMTQRALKKAVDSTVKLTLEEEVNLLKLRVGNLEKK